MSAHIFLKFINMILKAAACPSWGPYVHALPEYTTIYFYTLLSQTILATMNNVTMNIFVIASVQAPQVKQYLVLGFKLMS